MHAPSEITLGALQAHLWEAANILRGPVDAADFKIYVFPLMFFKRISDVHDEEYQAALAESGGDEDGGRRVFSSVGIVDSGDYSQRIE